MKTGKTLTQLATEIDRQRNAKKDFIAPSGKLTMATRNGPGPLLNVGDQPFAINPLAHQQLAEYTSIPKAYYDQMMQKAPELLVSNVNHWLSSKVDDKRLVRTLDGNVRALLSDRYRPLDNADLAEAVLPVLMERDLMIVSCEITERRLYIKAFDRRIEREIKAKGTDPAHTFLKDVVAAAICISNSDVGAGALSVAAGLYTGGCTNFAAFNDSRMRKYHIGGKALDSADVYTLLTDSTKKLTDAAIWAQTKDVVASAFDRVRFDALVDRVQETAEHKITGDVVEVVNVTGEQFGFTKGERQSVLKHLIEGGNLSRYGLFNAITRAAEDADDYERASEFERAGGKVIELPFNDWERLAKAA